jgi:hypothetical protein
MSVDEGEGHGRRLTGLRSLRRDDSNSALNGVTIEKKDERETMDTRPVDVQGVWRNWMAQPRRLPYVLTHP